MELSVPIALITGACVFSLAVLRKADSLLVLTNAPALGAYEYKLIFSVTYYKNTVVTRIGCDISVLRR